MPDACFAPKIIILPLQYACDARCVMCNIWERKERRHWEPNELRRILGHPGFRTTEVVNVTGGEPSLLPELPELIEVVLDCLPALRVLSLQTNAMNPARLSQRLPRVIDLFRQRQLAGQAVHLDFNISLDGAREIHDKVRGVSGAFAAVVDSLAYIREWLADVPRSKFMFNCTVVRQNVAHLDDVQQCADELGVEITYTIPQQTDVYLGNQTTNWRFELNADEQHLLAKFLRRRLAMATGRSAMSPRYCRMLLNLLENGERGIDCPLAVGGMFLEPGGQALPCWNSAALAVGNILTEGVDTVLERRAADEFQQRLRQHCRTCSINCYVDWTRREFAIRTSQQSEGTS
jgi:MoaA/NifB/PqqE/SkfB family radical SAM enzyme